MRIMTGAFVPEGADTVVQVELTDGGLDLVVIEHSLKQGASICRRGEDVRAGDVALSPKARGSAPRKWRCSPRCRSARCS